MDAALPYQRSFGPNWIRRAVVEVLLMAPAVPENAGRIGGCGWSEHDQVWSVEIGSVQEIEDFGAKLKTEALRDSRVFQNREIPIYQARANERISAQITVKAAGGRRSDECRGIEPLIRSAQDNRADKIWTDEWPDRISGVAVVGWVVAELWSEGNPDCAVKILESDQPLTR
jgi:hypothetical protein